MNSTRPSRGERLTRSGGLAARTARLSGPAALLAALALLSCGDAPPADSTPGSDARPAPVMLIGLDGLEWQVMLPLLQAGRMPRIAALMERGHFGALESMRPTSSPIIWTSIATGQSAEKHGIQGFVDKRLDPENPRLYDNRDRRTKAIWNILGENERVVNVVGWWMTYPTERINGVMVAQTNVLPGKEEAGGQLWKGSLYADVPGQVYPEALQAELLAGVEAVDAELPALVAQVFGALPETLPGVPGILWRESLWSIRADEIYRRVSLELLSRERPFDLFAVYFGGTDVLGHRYWRYLQPRRYRVPPTPAEVELVGELIPAYYAHVDRLLGQLLDAAPAELNVMVVSDHGMGPLNTAASFAADQEVRRLRSGGHPNAPAGVFVAAGPDFRERASALPLATLELSDLQTIGSMLDITPTLLAMYGIPIGADMDGAPMSELIEPELLADRPVQRIETHSPPGWRDDLSEVRDRGSAERIDQLRGLGYLDDDDEDE